MLLKDCTTIYNGSTPNTSEPSFWDGNIIWITPKDLSTYTKRYIEKGERNITQAGYDSCSTKMLPKNTIVLTSRAPIGYLAIAKYELCTNQGFKSLVCKDSILPLYLYYWLSTKIDYLKSISSGATFKELSKDTLENISINLPSLLTQQHIVDTIGSVDDAIEKNEETIAKLEKYADNVYNIYTTTPKNNILRLGNCVNIVTGKLNANASAQNGSYKFFTCSHEDLKINTYSFDCEAIILSGNGEIEVKYYKGKFDAYQRTYVLCPNKYFFLFLIEMKRQISSLKTSSQGSVIKFITKGMIENIPININNQSDYYNNIVANVYHYIHYLKNKNERMKVLKQLLLNKYFD